ncbi:MAG: trypsin-like peptidase domain-containing protein [candidate division NC10 bacterium]|nr:PDZ domain-containing protein [candidate division NC10 bacterium]MCH7896830.1 trypsin-like peptidase domain-containing protein [candidate division NC10 bacterium]
MSPRFSSLCYQINKRTRIVYCTLILLCSYTAVASADNWAEKINRLKPTVVNLEVTTQVNLGLDKAGTRHGTGFIVDAKRGIIATNRHISSTSPSHFKITFIDGSSTEGRLLYYDYYHDFAFIQFDASSVSLQLKQATLGSSLDLRPQEAVLLIGNNDREEYSVKIGMVINSKIDKGERHSSTIHTSFDRTGGSSGSPVFSENERVIGIHFGGTHTSSFELPIEYIKDSLRTIQNGELPQRGDLGVELGYVNLDDAIKHLGITDYHRKVYKRRFPGATKVIQIQGIIPASPAQNVLKPGDIIWSVADQLIGDNLYLFDKLIDQHVNHTVSITVLRREEAIAFDLAVLALEQEKTKRFVLFGGGIFQDITAKLRRSLNYEGDGVFMNNVRTGSAFSSLGLHTEKNPTARRVIIRELDGKRITYLDDFIKVAHSIDDGTYTTVMYQDLFSVNTAPKVAYTSFDLMFSGLRIVELSDGSGNWEEVK